MGGKRIQPGEVYGQLTTERMEHVMAAGGRVRSHWRCKCTCGGSILVDSGNLRTGNTTRCGECTAVAKGIAKTTHGHTRGRSPTKTYTAWQSMWSRCTDPKNKRYADYGGRGIGVDPAWRSFEAFLEAVGEAPTEDHQIERRDNEKGYSEDNCYWATRVEQANNKRNSHLIEYQGRTQTLTLWCRELGLNYDATKARIYKGWPVEKAFVPGDARTLLHPLHASRTTVS